MKTMPILLLAPSILLSASSETPDATEICKRKRIDHALTPISIAPEHKLYSLRKIDTPTPKSPGSPTSLQVSPSDATLEDIEEIIKLSIESKEAPKK